MSNNTWRHQQQFWTWLLLTSLRVLQLVDHKLSNFFETCRLLSRSCKDVGSNKHWCQRLEFQEMATWLLLLRLTFVKVGNTLAFEITLRFDDFWHKDFHAKPPAADSKIRSWVVFASRYASMPDSRNNFLRISCKFAPLLKSCLCRSHLYYLRHSHHAWRHASQPS